MKEALESKILRLLYVILFYVIFSVMDVVMLVIVVIQSALNLLTGEPSESLKSFGESLAIYLKQVTEFLTHASDDKPFPFADWPVPSVSGESSSETSNQ